MLWQIAYYATAVLAGLILLTGAVPSPLDFVAYLALGVGATWMPLAWILGRSPFY